MHLNNFKFLHVCNNKLPKYRKMLDHPIENSLLPSTAAWPIMPWDRYHSADLSVWGWLGTVVEVSAKATCVATVNFAFTLSFIFEVKTIFVGPPLLPRG